MFALLNYFLYRLCAWVFSSVLYWLDYRQVFDVRKTFCQLAIECCPTVLTHKITWQGFLALTALNVDWRELSSKDLCLVSIAKVVNEGMFLVDQLEVNHSKAICAVPLERILINGLGR